MWSGIWISSGILLAFAQWLGVPPLIGVPLAFAAAFAVFSDGRFLGEMDEGQPRRRPARVRVRERDPRR